MPSAGTRKRISRIRRRAIPEVAQAYKDGQISARRADVLLYLPPEEQLTELVRLLSVQEAAQHRSQVAARIIKAHVVAGRRDLMALQRDLQRALSNVTV
jgi:hypothetical protein